MIIEWFFIAIMNGHAHQYGPFMNQQQCEEQQKLLYERSATTAHNRARTLPCWQTFR